MMNSYTRAFRTPSSERFLLQSAQGTDIAALDLHYLPSGKVAGTLILFDDAGISDESVPHLLKKLDEELLPEVSMEEGGLSFTVVRGRVIGNFVPEPQDSK